MDEAAKTQIVQSLFEIIIDLAPDANLRPMYGGTMIELVKGDPKSHVGGVFAYSNHVSLELSNGSTFDDPAGHLEGAGKFRRQVKLRSIADITNKDCAGFLAQAVG